MNNVLKVLIIKSVLSVRERVIEGPDFFAILLFNENAFKEPETAFLAKKRMDCFVFVRPQLFLCF
jgi:hypothetical protein